MINSAGWRRERSQLIAPRRQSRVLIVVLVAAALVAGVLGYRTLTGGPRLRLIGGNAIGGSAPIGVPFSVGIPMWTEGGSRVALDSVDADHSANVTVRYSLVTTGPGEGGIGAVTGSIDAWQPAAVDGAHVAQPARKAWGSTCTTAGPAAASLCSPQPPGGADPGSTQLVVTVTATAPGPWSVTDFRVRYSSGVRARTAHSDFVVRGVAGESS